MSESRRKFDREFKEGAVRLTANHREMLPRARVARPGAGRPDRLRELAVARVRDRLRDTWQTWVRRATMAAFVIQTPRLGRRP